MSGNWVINPTYKNPRWQLIDPFTGIVVADVEELSDYCSYWLLDRSGEKHSLAGAMAACEELIRGVVDRALGETSE